MSKSLLALVCCLLAFGYAAPAGSNAFHEVLGRWSEPHVSADGNAVVASVAIPDFVGTVYRWTLSDSGVMTETLPLDHAHVQGTNRDGSVIVGTTVGGAFRWTAAGGKQILGAPESSALDVSSDGAVVVGVSSWVDGGAFYWTEALGFLPLGFLRGDTKSQAMAVAGRGLPVVGVSMGPPRTPPAPDSVRAFHATPGRGMQSLGSLPGRTGPGQALGVSSDGQVIVGQFDFEAFRWTAADGMVGLGFLPGHTTSVARDVSGDGERIVGYSLADDDDQAAFVWTPDRGMRSLEMLLGAGGGVDLAGVELNDANSISDDGRVIAGWGRRDGRGGVTWIAELTEIPPPDTFRCYDTKTSRGSARFEAREVSLSDPFGDSVQTVNKGRRLCAPVQLDRTEVSEPEAHLLCYDLARRGTRDHHEGSEPIEVRVSNRFGDDQPLTVKRPKSLCVPSTVERVESGATPGDPSELELDHFLCYGVRSASRDFDPVEVSLADSFHTSERLLKKARLLCNSVDKNAEGVLDPTAHLACYDIRPPRGGPASRRLNLDVLVNNQFDAEQHFTLKKPKTVCVPSQMELVDDGPAACSAIEPGEFGLCRMIIGWGIDPETGQCAGISGCGCDERCDERVFEDEATCQQACGGERNQHFSVTKDARRCISPLCGGWWVEAVNEALTRCADGSWAPACYVAALDRSRASGDFTEFNNSHNNLAVGRIKPKDYPGFGNLGELVITDAWYGADPVGFRTKFGPKWSAVWDNGIRCTTSPCYSTDQEFLNTGATGNLSGLDLSAVAADQAEMDLARWLLANDRLLAAGQNVLFPNQGPAGDGVALIANQFYLPLPGSGGKPDR